MEEVVADDCVVDLFFKDVKKAFFADLLVCFWSFDHCAFSVTELALWHSKEEEWAWGVGELRVQSLQKSEH